MRLSATSASVAVVARVAPAARVRGCRVGDDGVVLVAVVVARVVSAARARGSRAGDGGVARVAVVVARVVPAARPPGSCHRGGEMSPRAQAAKKNGEYESQMGI